MKPILNCILRTWFLLRMTGRAYVDAQTKSAQTDITIQTDGTLKEDKTYALPIALTHVSSDITIKDEKLVIVSI